MGGPVAGGKHTSFVFTIDRSEENLQSIVFAESPAGQIHGIVPQPDRGLELSASLSHQMGKRHTLSLRFTDEMSRTRNQGIGGTTLAESGANDRGDEAQVVLGARTVLSGRLLNEFRLLVGHEASATVSLHPGRRIVVVDAFTGGGAQADQRTTEDHFNLAESLTLMRGKHLVKAGIQVPDFSRRGFDDRSNREGTFIFSSLADYAGGRPLSFSQQQGDGTLVFLQKVFGTFIQDQISVNDRLSITPGIRYDWQNIFKDDNNVAPRLSVAYAVDTRTAIRGGGGVFYDRAGDGPIREVLRSREDRLRRVSDCNSRANGAERAGKGERSEVAWPWHFLRPQPALPVPPVTIAIGHSMQPSKPRFPTRNLRRMALVALAVLDACRLPAPTSTPPPAPVLNAVLLPGQRLTFARPDGNGGYEAIPASSAMLRFTSAWPLDGERIEVTVSPFTGAGGSSKLTWVRRDDMARKQQLASAGYIETVVDGYGYSVILTPPSALRTATGINVALRTSQGGTPANPASYSAYISLLLKPKAARTLPSAVFFDCTEQGGGGVGSWYNTCKNSSSIVARDVVLEGWVRNPGPNWFGGTNDPIWVEDWHYEFAPDPDFIEQMYGPAGAFASLGDRTLESAPTLLHGNPPGAPAAAMPIADRSTTGQSLGITVNSFLQPDNRASTDPLDSEVVIKAELNAWHVNNQGSPLCGRYLGFCRNWIGRGLPPGADWISLTQAAYGGGVDATAAGNAFWPYDPRLLRSGQSLGDGEYVRVGGTLWQDTDHGGVIRWTSLKPAFGGWFEIHPVDWIVRSTPPAVPKTIRMVETINWLPTDFAETRNLAPSNPMPNGAVLRCRELIDGRFTDPASVLQHSALVQTADVVVQTTVSRFTPAPPPGRAGRFKAAYVLWWEQGGEPRAACTQG